MKIETMEALIRTLTKASYKKAVDRGDFALCAACGWPPVGD